MAGESPSIKLDLDNELLINESNDRQRRQNYDIVYYISYSKSTLPSERKTHDQDEVISIQNVIQILMQAYGAATDPQTSDALQ